MEKFVNILKGLAIFVVIAFIGIGIYDLATKTGGFLDSIISIFKNEPIIIDPHKNASSNLIPFTKEEIDAETSNPECPDLGDLTDKIYIQEYNDVVVFYKEEKDAENKTFYPNLLFLKTKEGLVYNGCINLHAQCVNWFGSEKDFKWQPNFYEKPFVGDFANWWHESNIVIYSSGNTCSFIEWGGLFRIVDAELYLNKARDYINENIYPYFLSFYNDNIKIYQESKETAGIDFDAFYDFVYRSYKTGELAGTVDMTKYTFYQIPEEEQTKYPMNESENFKFYKYNFFLRYDTEKINRNLINMDWQENIDANLEEIETSPIEDEPTTIPTVVLRLKDSGYDVDLSSGALNAMREFFKHYQSHGEILEEHPVVFEFSQNGEKLKNYKFASYNDIFNGVSLNLKPGEYDYSITSEAFIFNSTYGKLEVSKSSTVQFEYSYLEDSVVSTFSLKSLTTTAIGTIKNNPVKITFSNKETNATFNLTFDGYAVEEKTLILPFGTYEYQINSEYLLFSPTSGEITVSATNYSFIFEYFLKTDARYVLSVKTGSSDTLTIKIPTIERVQGNLYHNAIKEVWIYHTLNNETTIKKITAIENNWIDENIVTVPYSELNDNFGNGLATYQIRVIYNSGEEIFTNAVQSNRPVEFSVSYIPY